MPFASLREKQRLYTEIVKASEALAGLCASLSDGEFEEVLADLKVARTQEKHKGMAGLFEGSRPTQNDESQLDTREMILQLLRENPDGLKPGVIIDKLEDQIQTTSKDRRAPIYAAINALKKQKKIAKDTKTKKYRVLSLQN